MCICYKQAKEVVPSSSLVEVKVEVGLRLKLRLRLRLGFSFGFLDAILI